MTTALPPIKVSISMKIRHRKAWVCALVAGAFLALACALPNRALAREGLVVGFSDFPPFRLVVDGQAAGIDAEIVRRAARLMGTTVAFRKGTFLQVLDDLRFGRVDLMTGLLKTEERGEFIHYIEPAYAKSPPKVFYVLRGQGHLLKSFSDLKNLTVGVKKGVDYFPRFDKASDIRKISAPGFQGQVRMLTGGMVDCIATTATEGEFWLKVLGLERIIVPAPYSHDEPQPMYFGFSRASGKPRQADAFQKALETLIDNGEVSRIKERFLHRAVTPESRGGQSP